MLTETSVELLDAIRANGVQCNTMHTGGGCHVLRIPLRNLREVWMTREDNWIIGFYDFLGDIEDEGICTYLLQPAIPNFNNRPEEVAKAIVEILRRVGAKTYDASTGE